jgi:uncharacterized protein (DUF362 family)
MTRVAIAHGHDPRAMVLNVLDLIGAEEVVRTDDSVVLKPNYVEPMRPEDGVTTDPRVIEAVVVWLQSRGVRDITIAEGGDTAAGTDRAFAMVGLPALAERLGVRLVNALRDERVEVEVPNALSLHRVHVSRTIYEATCLIGLPKLKCHSMAGVTLSIKNLMGAVVPDKTIMHRQLHRRLTDLATILRPKICVIDGLVGAERHETAGDPVRHDIVIAGTDPVATDVVGTMAMGLDPAGIEHLRLCAERGLGENRPDHIELLGVSLDRVRKQYRSW